MVKTALISGISGQTGSYLAELLLEKGYEVHGIIRRSSSLNTGRIDHIFDELQLHYGDITDSCSTRSIIENVRPDRIYNLACQSHVKVSFEIPDYSIRCSLGLLYILDAVRDLNLDARIYQASSSELFGSTPPPQNETTPFHPRSPYSCGKMLAYNLAINYREAYNMFVCNGILFNHSCISENTTVILRDSRTGIITIARAKDIRKCRSHARQEQWILDNTEIWDGQDFVKLKMITATRLNSTTLCNDEEKVNFKCKTINCICGLVETTNHHNMLIEDSSKTKMKELNLGDKVLTGKYPISNNIICLTEEESQFLGLMVSDGSISLNKDTLHVKASFSNKDMDLISITEKLWSLITGGYSTLENSSGSFKPNSIIYRITLNGNPNYFKYIYNEIYTYDGFKKIPDRILNASSKIQEAFLHGYNLGDGLKANKCIYKYKNFKTDSIVLAHGLIYLIKNTTNQDYNLTFEQDEKYYGYYSINLLSKRSEEINNKIDTIKNIISENKNISQREINRRTGFSRITIRKIQKDSNYKYRHQFYNNHRNEIKKMFYHDDQPDVVYDFETETGKFMAGVGNIVISNSPRRTETFASRKITRAVARIKLGLQKDVKLGNLDAKRDDGYAKEYAEAMYLMLEHEKPDDFVIATGEMHSIKEWCEEAFSYVGLNWKDYVIIDPKYFRPSEVDALCGNASKAKKILGWEPKTKFKDLCHLMVDHDLEMARKEII